LITDKEEEEEEEEEEETAHNCYKVKGRGSKVDA